MAGIKISKNSQNGIVVSFPYDPQLVEKIKTIEGRKWHKNEKYWSFPDSEGTTEKILKVFDGEEILIDPSLQSQLSTHIIYIKEAKGRKDRYTMLSDTALNVPARKHK